MSWNEFLPRYLLIEEGLHKKSVLEVGTLDIRSLSKLSDAGAVRVLGVAPDPSRFDRAVLKGRAIDLLRMESGQLDFGDASFDVILVVDLARELSHNPSFLLEMRRILRADGMALLGYAANGRSLVELIDEDPKVLPFEPHELDQSVRAVFPEARFYLQSPFVGVAIHPQGMDPATADVSLDPSLAGGSRASHVIALCGRAPAATYRTLVELPFVAFEAMTEAAQERSQSDLARLLDALRAAREQITARDRSLEEIKRRLPRIREAIVASRRASGEPSVSVPSPTIIERPTDDGRAAELEARLEGLDEALRDERARRLALEARIKAADLAADLESSDEAQRLEHRIRELEADLEDTISLLRHRDDEKAELLEARRRITQLERTASSQEQENDELRRELDGQSLVRHSLGDEYRDAEARIAFLNGRIDDMALASSQELKRADERIQFLANALNSSDQERESLRLQLAEFEGQFERSQHAERGQRHATEELEAERSEHYQVRNRFDEIRVELHEKSSNVEWLERELSDREAQIMFLQKERSSAGADRKAVEMAAAHLSKEVEQLRKRTQELRNDRDTLAATSRLLLEERDTAAQLARHAVEAEERAQQLQLSLEGGQAAIERLEREVEEIKTARGAIERRWFETEEKNRMLEKDLERERIAHESVVSRSAERQARESELDRKLAELTGRLMAIEAQRDRTQRDNDRLQELLLESHRESAQAHRSITMLEGRVGELGRLQKAAEQDIGRVLAERAATEAEATRARAIADDYRGKNALLVAELADVAGRDQNIKKDLRSVTRELEQTEVALSKTLSEAAGLDARLKDLERLIEAGERERIQIERQRQAAESSKKSVEAARAHSVAEVRALNAERAQLIGQHEAELHSMREQVRAVAQDDSLREKVRALEAERFALMVWAEELEVSRQLAEENADRLRTDSARHQIATEEAQDEARVLDLKLGELERVLGLREPPYAIEREENETRIAILDAENVRLRQNLVATKQELSDRAETIDLLELKDREGRKQRALAESKLNVTANEVLELNERLLELASGASRGRNELDMLQRALADSRAATERAERRATDLEKASVQLEQLKAQLSGTAKRIAMLEESEREAVELRGELAGTQAEVGDLRSRLAALTGELGRATTDNAVLRSTIHAGSARTGELEMNVVKAGERIMELERQSREATDLVARLQKAERRTNEVQAALANAELLAGAAEAAVREAGELRAKLLDAERRVSESEEKVRNAAQTPSLTSLEERAQRAELSTARVEGQLAKEASAARDAETRARNAEALARASEDRANAAETRRRSAEVRALDAEAKSKHAERRLHELELHAKHLESQSSSSSDASARARVGSLEQALDEARADVGRRLAELKTAREEKSSIEREMEEQKIARRALEEKLARQGDAERLKEEVDQRDQQIARLRADAGSMLAEKNRVRAMIESSEQNQVQLERRIAELETALAESTQQVDLLRRDLSERTERLRRLSSGINEPT